MKDNISHVILEAITSTAPGTKECIADFLDQMLSNTIDPKETLVKELRCSTYHNNFCLKKYNCMCFFPNA